jgi:D-glycero-D-manno-heptose 1,7-bisphosphate phosphatase
VYNISTGEYESPHFPDDFSIYPYVLKSLKLLKKLGFINIIISNQPDYAKGKATIEDIKLIEKQLSDFSEENGTIIDKYYYCYHHPDGIIPEYTRKCFCRKPKTLFLEDAIKRYDLNIHQCYFIGDQDTDIRCGKSIDVYTIKINNKYSLRKSGKEAPNEIVSNLYEAVLVIKKLNS